MAPTMVEEREETTTGDPVEPVPPLETPDPGETGDDDKDDDSESESTDASDIARQVIAGHWGRGNDRKQRLMDAGYDVAEVSAEMKKIFNQ